MTEETQNLSSNQSGLNDQTMPDSGNNHLRTLKLLQVLILDALNAGKYIPPHAGWEPYQGGQRLVFRDRRVGEELSGALVLAECVTEEILYDPATAEFGSMVIVGVEVAANVDLGKARAHRLELSSPHREVYWAVFILQDSVLVTIGGPPSPCRLISEILNAQVGEPFVRRRICSHCHEVNDYHARNCARCGKSIISTGRLNPWME